VIAAGALTKSAQWPFHFWLPNAMAAPTPVSAYLHSATMVKAGVYLLARLAPGLGGTPLWFWLLTLAGGATILAAAGLALLQRDSKRLLAYSTLIALGTLVLLIGVGTESAIKAMVVFLFAHALYKAPLFMVAGSVDHEAGSRDVTACAGWGAPCRGPGPPPSSPASAPPGCRPCSASSARSSPTRACSTRRGCSRR
jgi:multicomponent Na+:H+ antiporter subunit A